VTIAARLSARPPNGTTVSFGVAVSDPTEAVVVTPGGGGLSFDSGVWWRSRHLLVFFLCVCVCVCFTVGLRFFLCVCKTAAFRKKTKQKVGRSVVAVARWLRFRFLLACRVLRPREWVAWPS